MKLRYLQVYDKNGCDIEGGLQYWNENFEEWCYIETIRIRFDKKEEAMHEEDYRG